MTTYERTEFAERARRVFNPGSACGAAVKAAVTRCADELGVSWHRARDLMRGKALPTVREMDFVRVKDGVWCNRMKRAKAAVEDKIEDIWEFVRDLGETDLIVKLKRRHKERKLSKQSFIGRAYAHHDDRA